MATTSTQQPRVESSASAEDTWAELKPKNVDYVKKMGEEKVKIYWERIYREAGLRNPSEKTRRACRLGVYVYCYKNGSSREGEYSGYITMNDGHKFEAAILVKVVGKMDVRRFMRGNANEAYVALKVSKAIEEDEEAVAKVASYGIRAEHAFATADFFDQCPLLTPAETLAHDTVFNHRLQKSERARGGKSLEEVEDTRLDEKLKAQERSGVVGNGSTF